MIKSDDARVDACRIWISYTTDPVSMSQDLSKTPGPRQAVRFSDELLCLNFVWICLERIFFPAYVSHGSTSSLSRVYRS